MVGGCPVIQGKHIGTVIARGVLEGPVVVYLVEHADISPAMELIDDLFMIAVIPGQQVPAGVAEGYFAVPVALGGLPAFEIIGFALSDHHGIKKNRTAMASGIDMVDGAKAFVKQVAG